MNERINTEIKHSKLSYKQILTNRRRISQTDKQIIKQTERQSDKQIIISKKDNLTNSNQTARQSDK